jgi:hypothetical protein
MTTTGIKVRFNLGRGANYKKWKIIYPEGLIVYHNPNEVQLILKTCRLINQKNQSKKIFDGANKSVCAWVLCEEIEIHYGKPFNVSDNPEIRFNPRIKPNWVVDGVESDNLLIREVVTDENKLYLSVK